MLNKSIDTLKGNAQSLIRGHHQFLLNNTGITNDGKYDHFVLNPEGVLANNRHFLAYTRQEYHPSGDATTEGQSVLILGYLFAYLGTRNPEYLERAKYHFDAYVEYFYAGQPIPETPQRWICNWIVNGKEPVLANYPINPTDPTESGFKAIELDYVSGKTKVPHGAPYFGEWLDVVSFAFEGALGWGAINASVFELRADGSVDWSKDGKIYDVDYMIAWTGEKISGDGNVISTDHPVEEFGTIQLKDTTVNQSLKTNFSPRPPVEVGGRYIERNEVQHNRPLHVPLLGSVNQMGNAADGEVWFVDCCYLLHKITGDEKYLNALKCTLFNIEEYTDIDSSDMFFRQSLTSYTPFTDGISYHYTYPSDTPIEFGRDGLGYITARSESSVALTMEQQAVVYRVNQDSICEITFGGVGDAGASVNASATLMISDIKRGGVTLSYNAALPTSNSMQSTSYEIPLRKFYQTSEPDTHYHTNFISSGFIVYGGAINENVDDAEHGQITKTNFPDNSAGLIYDLELATVLNNITYKADGDMDLRIQDDNGWNWYWILPSTAGEFVNRVLDPNDMILSSWQPDGQGETPTSPVFTEISQIEFMLEVWGDSNKNLWLASFNNSTIKGAEYLLVDAREAVPSTNTVTQETYSTDILNKYDFNVLTSVIPTSDDELVYGFWLRDNERITLDSLTYRSNKHIGLRVEDDNGWVWFWDIDNSNNEWITKTLSKNDMWLSDYQPNHDVNTETLPVAPVFTTLTQVTFKPTIEGQIDTQLDLLCFNELPPTFEGADGWTQYFTLVSRCSEASTTVIGNCRILDYREDSLAYCPGVIPFSNIYQEGTDTIGAWHGLPYPSYQFPMIFSLGYVNNAELRFNNQVDFLYDAQQFYYAEIGELGPCASAYIWDRWDNYKYGDPDTFTMYHWGGAHAWDGYQPRVYYWAARSLHELVMQGKPINQKLWDLCQNWTIWLIDFFKKNGVTPTYFPSDAPAEPQENDFTGHMSGLWLGGACLCSMSGMEIDGLDDYINGNYLELEQNYEIIARGDPMNGCWSSWSGGGYFYGFWAGEILKALGLYLLYLDGKRNFLLSDLVPPPQKKWNRWFRE